jgi:tetratricopeptide (TPR) repeat protein
MVILMASEFDEEFEFRRANRYFARGNFKRSENIFRAVLDREPENARAQGAVVLVENKTGKRTFDEALTQIRALVAAHPDEGRLRGTLVTILLMTKHMDDAAVERQRYFELFPDSPSALQMWANGLQYDPETKDNADTPTEAWGYYQQALLSGPLSSPCFKQQAYAAARKVDREHANEAFNGSSLIERTTIRTRSLGQIRLISVFLIGLIVGAALLPLDVAASIAFQSLNLAWGLWISYANSQMCCKKCRNAWLGLVSIFAVLGAFSIHFKLFFCVTVAIAVVSCWAGATGKIKPLGSSYIDAEKQGVN